MHKLKIRLDGILCEGIYKWCNSYKMRALLFAICIYVCSAHDFSYFEQTLASKSDGYESIWSLKNIDCELDAYTVTDVFLQKFLGINDEYPYVLLTLKDNATDFDTHVWEPNEWSIVTDTGENAPVSEQISTLLSMKASIPPKVWKQPKGTHEVLNLEYAPEKLQGPNVSFILYFSNETRAMDIADTMHVVGAKYPEVKMYCWDLMVSYGPQPFQYIPTVVVHNKAVHGDSLKELQQPFTQEQFDQFVDANLEMQDINTAYLRHMNL